MSMKETLEMKALECSRRTNQLREDISKVYAEALPDRAEPRHTQTMVGDVAEWGDVRFCRLIVGIYASYRNECGAVEAYMDMLADFQ